MRSGSFTDRQPVTGARALPGYGQGKAVISSAELIEIDADEVTRRLKSLFASPDYRPPLLPAAATELMRLSSLPTVDARDIVEVLGTDPLLMGRVLATAQSAAYGAGGQVTTLSDAVRRLGLRGLRNIVIEVALNLRVFRSACYADTMQSIRKHSLVTAHFATLTARFMKADPQEAFLAALMHDVGFAGGLLVLAEGHSKDRSPSLVRFGKSLEASHVDCSVAMLANWGFSEALRTAVGAHHAPVRAQLTGDALRLAGSVLLADHFAHLAGGHVNFAACGQNAGTPGSADETDTRAILELRDAIGITADDLGMLLEATRALYPRIG